MGRELINRITVRKDGRVFVSSHSSNDDSPYHSWEISSLTEIYRTGGQQALDKEILGMLHDYCELRGSHSSVMRLKNILNSREARKLYRTCVSKIDAAYEALAVAERHLIYHVGKDLPDSVKKYKETEKKCFNEYYEAVAKLLNSDVKEMAS